MIIMTVTLRLAAAAAVMEAGLPAVRDGQP
jgi:hypothetical protein